MPDQPSNNVTVTSDAEGDQRTLDLLKGFVDPIREPDESVADVVPVSINAMREGRCPKELIDALDSFADAMVGTVRVSTVIDVPPDELSLQWDLEGFDEPCRRYVVGGKLCDAHHGGLLDVC